MILMVGIRVSKVTHRDNRAHREKEHCTSIGLTKLHLCVVKSYSCNPWWPYISKSRCFVLGTKVRVGPAIPDNAVQDVTTRPSAPLAIIDGSQTLKL